MVLTAALLVGACSSDPAPKEPAGTPSASSQAPTAAPPTMPAQAREDSPEGAAAFVVYYIDVFNHAARTGDVTELSKLSSPDCTGCQRYIKLYRDTYAAGGYFKGGDWKLGELTLEPSETETFITTEVTSTATAYRRRSGSPERLGPEEKNTITLAVTKEPGRRIVSQMALGGAR